MSFDVFWDALDAEAATAVQRFLNDRFAQLPTRPGFLGAVTFANLSFGTVAPTIALLNLVDPFPDFYWTHETGRAPTPEPSSALPHGEDDMMAIVRFEYKGDFQVQVSTELKVNYPTDSFVSLPVTLSLNAVVCSGTALLANVQDKVFVSLYEDDGKGCLGSPFHLDMKLESQVGDSTKQAIRSLSHVLERFILDQLQRLVRQQLIFPNHVGVPRRALSANNTAPVE